MRKTAIVLVVIIAVLAAAAAYLYFTPGATDFLKSRKVITDPKTINKIAVGYVRNPYKDDYDMARIAGWVDNLGKGTLSKVVFEIRLLDTSGNKKERVTYTVYDVPAGRRKTFDANAGQIPGPRTAEARIVRIEVLQ